MVMYYGITVKIKLVTLKAYLVNKWTNKIIKLVQDAINNFDQQVTFLKKQIKLFVKLQIGSFYQACLSFFFKGHQKTFPINSNNMYFEYTRLIKV